MRYILDTNICIYIIKRRPAKVLRRLRKMDISDLGLSAITVSELDYGAEKSSRPVQSRRALARFLAAFEIAPYDGSAAQAHGRIRAALERQGQPIGPLDLLIAAHAVSLVATLVTNNEREFARVPGLAVENWAT